MHRVISWIVLVFLQPALCGFVLFTLVAGARAGEGAGEASNLINAPPQNKPTTYSAKVKPTEAIFTMLVPSRPKWNWRRPETKDNAREYRMDVSVTNNGQQYNFGFYLWKFPGARPGSGDLAALIRTGQASVFERAAPNRNVLLKDAGINLKLNGDRLTITIHSRNNVKRLFSSRPIEATFNITTPDSTPVSQTTAIEYQD